MILLSNVNFLRSHKKRICFGEINVKIIQFFCKNKEKTQNNVIFLEKSYGKIWENRLEMMKLLQNKYDKCLE